MDAQVIDTDRILADAEGWQRMLDTCPKAFSTIDPGGRIGIFCNGDFSTSIAALDGTMLVWNIEEDGVSVNFERFKRQHFHRANVDLLFVVDDDTLAMMHGATEEVLVEELVKRANHGQIILFFMIGRDDLEDYGYYDFLEVVGLSFLGPCR